MLQRSAALILCCFEMFCHCGIRCGGVTVVGTAVQSWCNVSRKPSCPPVAALALSQMNLKG